MSNRNDIKVITIACQYIWQSTLSATKVGQKNHSSIHFIFIIVLNNCIIQICLHKCWNIFVCKPLSVPRFHWRRLYVTTEGPCSELQNAFNRTDAPSKVIAHKNASRIVSVYCSWNVRETSDQGTFPSVVSVIFKGNLKTRQGIQDECQTLLN